MIKVNSNEKKIEELLNRGVETIYPGKKELKTKLSAGERLRLYCGFDPSAPSLHIGNAIALNKLSQFQELGHEVIFLIGDFTGMIGDPTDKSATRKKLTREEVRHNCRTYKRQAGAYLDFSGKNPARLKYNSEWSDKLTFKDLIEVSSNFTVQQMIQRDMFQKRLKEEKPIHLHEFLYPLAQGYDSVAMDVDLEVGGNDQMFNMMAGRDLMRSMGMKNKFVMTLKLLADDKGKKMGKSEGNAVFLDQAPEDIYGAVMSWSDGVIELGFELATKTSEDALVSIKKRLKTGENPRNLKMELAFELVKLVHGEKAAAKAQENFIRIIQKKEIPEEIKTITVDRQEAQLGWLLSKGKLTGSNGESRRLLKQGAIRVDNQTESDFYKNYKISPRGLIIQRGKRQFVKFISK